MSTNDEREALRSDSVAAAAKRHEAAEARWKEVVSVGLCEDDEPTKQAFTVGYVLALASLPAPAPAAYCNKCGYHGPADKYGGHNRPSDDQPCFYMAMPPEATPAAGEAVLWVSPGQLEQHTDPSRALADPRIAGNYIPARKTPAGKFTMPLYAAPQPPAPGGDAVEVLRVIASQHPKPELDEGEPGQRCLHCGYRRKLRKPMEHGENCAYALATAALANHSPDAGGVGEAWVCDGIPDEVIEAGISAWDAAKHDMENYVSGVTTDWDEGMIVAAIYKAMSAALCPADAEGGRG